MKSKVISKELVEVEYDEIIHTTDHAYLILICDEKVWISRSQCSALDEAEKTFFIPYWLAVNKGLI